MDELVKALRNCASADGSCGKCAYRSRVCLGSLNGCKWNMMNDAADAIEKLMAEVERLKGGENERLTGK